MKYLHLPLAAFCLTSLVPASSQAVDNVTWDASVGARYYYRSVDDGLDAKNQVSGRNTSNQYSKTMEYRGALAAEGKVKLLDWRFGIRTRNAANNDYVLFTQNQDYAIGIDTSYFRYQTQLGVTDLSVSLGRQKGAFQFESFSENLFSHAVRFDGLNWLFAQNSWGIGLGQYSLGALNKGTVGGSTYTTTDHSNSAGSTGSALAYLLTVQPYMELTLSKNIHTKLATGFYHWSHTDYFYSNTIHGGVASVSSGSSTGSLSFSNARQIQILNSWDFPFEMRLFGEWVKNLAEVNYTNSNTGANPKAWVAGLQYGSADHWHGTQATYAYTEKGLGAVAGDLTSSRIPPDNKGQIIALTYAAFENMQITGRAFFLNEISHKQSNGAAVTSTQDHKTTIWELGSTFNF